MQIEKKSTGTSPKQTKVKKTSVKFVTEQRIKDFINHVVKNDYKKADASLAAIVNEKIKARIRSANAALEASK